MKLNFFCIYMLFLCPETFHASQFIAQQQDPTKNVALNRPAYQSSTLQNAYYLAAAVAVDGNSNNNAHAKSCTHTILEQSPWWVVDLGRNYTIDHVKVTNRGDCCGECRWEFSRSLLFMPHRGIIRVYDGADMNFYYSFHFFSQQQQSFY